MGLSCDCYDYYDWMYEPPEDWTTAENDCTCGSCGKKINKGEECGYFRCYEHNEEGDEIDMDPIIMCERCTGLFWSLHELGYCITLPDDMIELAKMAAERR